MSTAYLEIGSARGLRPRLSSLPTNAFWNNSADCELKLHRIHAYPAKFPSFIATKALDYAHRAGVKVRTMADIFCGCGTVALEARRNGIDFWGCDINPVATLIARTKSSSYEPRELERYYSQIMAAFPGASEETDLSEAAVQRLAYWYSEKQVRDLAKLRNAITQSVPARSRFRGFFLCAFSNILKATSRWLTKSIKPQVDPHKRPIEVRKAFASQCSFMIEAFRQAGRPAKANARILTANVLTLQDPPCGIDMIVTSPPYVTSYEYADLHQLSSLWLGYADDYRTLRNGSIGSTQHDLDLTRTTKHLNNVGAQVVFSLFDRDKAIARSIAKYFLDIQAVSKRCFELVRQGGLAVFVIGNTEYLGVRVDNAAHLAESLLSSGFSRLQIAKRRLSGKILTPYRDRKGRFSRSSAGRHVYGEEFVLIATK
jgi:methylase of polypeptide subunit release factors